MINKKELQKLKEVYEILIEKEKNVLYKKLLKKNLKKCEIELEKLEK